MKRQADKPPHENNRKRPKRQEGTFCESEGNREAAISTRDQVSRERDALDLLRVSHPQQASNPGLEFMASIGSLQPSHSSQSQIGTHLFGPTLLGYTSFAEILSEIASRRSGLFENPQLHFRLTTPGLLQGSYVPSPSGLTGNNSNDLLTLLPQQLSVPMGSGASLFGSSLSDQITLARLQQGLLASQDNAIRSSYLPRESKEREAPASSLCQRPKGIPLSLPSDERHLSEYQIFIRKQVEIFEADEQMAASSAQGRNRSIGLGQIGVRCIHCARLPFRERPKGAVYFPSKLTGLYQASQNMQMNHFSSACQLMPVEERQRMFELKEQRSSSLGGGKEYWVNAARVLGIYETENEGLRLARG